MAESVEILAALPDDHRRAPSAAAWADAVRNRPDVLAMRADARWGLLAVVDALVAHTNRKSMTTRPTWERLVDLTGLSLRTVAYKLQWLRDHDCLGHVERGSTVRYRRGQCDELGNRAAVYLLAVPSPADPAPTCTPTRPPTGVLLPTTGARADSTTDVLRTSGDIENHWPDTAVTSTKADRIAAAATLRRTSPLAARLSERHLASVARDFLVAGWCSRDVAYALDCAPSGAHAYAYATRDIRNPAGWIAHRLAFWRNDAGEPLPSNRQQRQRIADQLRADRRTSAARAAAAATTEPGPAPRSHRAEIAAALGRRDAPAPAIAPSRRRRPVDDRALLAQARAEREQRERARLSDLAADDQPTALGDPDQAAMRRLQLARARAARERSL